MEGDTNAFQVLQAYKRHVDLVAPLFDQYRIFYGRPSDIELARQFLKARIEHQDSVVFMAVEDEFDEEVLGFAMLYPSYDSVAAAPMWILNDIFVDESARRRGIARALIERGKKLANETGAKVLSLDTGRDNEPSHVLYKSMGFVRDEAFCTYVLRM